MILDLSYSKMNHLLDIPGLEYLGEEAGKRMSD